MLVAVKHCTRVNLNVGCAAEAVTHYTNLRSASGGLPVPPTATSATVNTDGMRRGRVGRCTSASYGSLTPSTSRYKNSKALSAWLWVDTETLRSVVSMDSNC